MISQRTPFLTILDYGRCYLHLGLPETLAFMDAFMCSGYRISNYLAYKAQWWECRGPVMLSKTQEDMLYPSMRTVVVCPLRPASNWCWGAVGIKFLSSQNGPNQSYIEVEGSKKQPSNIFWDLRIMKAQEWIDRSELMRIILLKKSRKQQSKKKN